MNEFLLGTVTDVTDDGVKILFDGHTTATTKRYKQLITGIALNVDDRIVVTKIAGSYVVLGKIAYKQSGGGGGTIDVDDELDDTSENPVQNKVIAAAIEDLQEDVSGVESAILNKVDKSGDTMTGDLEITAGKSLLQDANTLIVGTRPSNNTYSNPISFRDKLTTLYAKLQGIFLTDGRVGTQLLATRTIQGETYENRVGMYVDEAGDSSVVVTAPAAWRTALGLGAAATRAVDTSPTADSANLITSGGVYNMVVGASAAFAIPASGSSVSKNMAGLTTNHILLRWRFSDSAENMPPADLKWYTYDGYFTITNQNGTTSETIRPIFGLPKSVTLSNH